jgi:starch phosphorylase
VISGWDNSGFTYTNVQADTMEMGSEITFEATISSPKVDHLHLDVYAVVDFDGESGVLKKPEFIKLHHVDDNNGGHYYKAGYKIGRAGKMKVGFALLPAHEFIKNIFELNMVKWA